MPVYTDELGNKSGAEDYLDETVTRSSKPSKISETPSSPSIALPKEKNVLNNYRSFNYIFTLAGLRKTDINDVTKYRNSTLDLIILRAGGKDGKGISGAAETSKASMEAYGKYDVKVKTTAQKSIDIVDGFNADSPGRFDMYIDNVEIESLMGFSEAGGVSQPTNISFDVIEPYSINGFIEALQVTAIAAGYPSYQDTSFLLKMEFIGYPDSSDFTNAESVERATRYYPIKLTGIEVTLDEKGTKYKVSAVPYNEAGFGKPSELKKSVQMSGKTVQTILQDLITNINSQIKESDDKSKKTAVAANDHDTYKIIFPVWNKDKGFVDGVNEINKIGKAEVTELLKDNALYTFPDNATATKPNAYQSTNQQNPSAEQNAKQPESFKLAPDGAPVAQFAEGKNIHECISAIIRDSHYMRNIVEKLSSPEWKKVVDDNGMVDYFLIKLETTNKQTINADAKRPYQIFTYVVTEHKILYTRIPNYGTQKVDSNNLAKLSLREYNYIYTGKNIDVLNFKLNFNTLFFEAIPAAMGISDAPASKDGAARGNNNDPKSNPDNIKDIQNSQVMSPPQKVDSTLTSVDKTAAGQRQNNAYAALAKGMHSAIVDSKASMLSGELDILGDPYYLVTGGIGNYNPKPSSTSNRMTEDGEAAHNVGEVLIIINFFNPIDISKLEQGGRLYFEPELVPFSGIYRVNKVKSTFKDGVFKQSLEIIRAAGQTPMKPGLTNVSSDPSKKLESIPDLSDQVSQDSTPATPVINTDTGMSGDRASTVNLMSQLERGLTSPGLPGQLSNFTAATGGLGGTVGNLLTQVSGATSNITGNSRIATQLFGGVIPGGIDQSSNGIPLQASAIVNLQQKILSSAALVNQAGNTVKGSFVVNNPTTQLANQIISKASNIINQVSVPGSGIGAGATVSYTPALPVSAIINSGGNITAQDIKLQSSTLPTDVTAVSGIASNLGPSAISAVANLGASSSKLVNGVGNNALSVTLGTPSDPLAIASQFGINASQLSGLSPSIQSKILSQLKNIGKNIPVDTNLSSAIAQGINLKSLTPTGIKNLPPTAPYAVSPGPASDTEYLKSIVARGGPAALAKSYGVNNINSIPQDQLSSDVAQSALSSVPAALNNPFGQFTQKNPQDLMSLSSKSLIANSQISGITGINGSIENALSSAQNKFNVTLNNGGNLDNSVTSKFGSLSKGESPLDKLMLR